jgi:hypothetical protein
MTFFSFAVGYIVMSVKNETIFIFFKRVSGDLAKFFFPIFSKLKWFFFLTNLHVGKWSGLENFDETVFLFSGKILKLKRIA